MRRVSLSEDDSFEADSAYSMTDLFYVKAEEMSYMAELLECEVEENW